MKTSDEMLTELSDREAIRDLPVRYCDCVWQGTLEAMLDLFAKDAVFITKGRQREAVSRGRDELRKMYQKALGDFTPRPYIHNHVVDLKGKTSATGRCYVELRSASRQMEWIGTGFYDDEYVREDGHWKFASRRFTGFGMQPAAAASGAQKS
jgi:ketosteroid isomerase-like protein